MRPIVCLTTAMLLTAFVVILAPSASAHNCSGVDPGSVCGDCSDGQAHKHTYANNPSQPDGAIYCQSSGPPPPPPPAPCEVGLGNKDSTLCFDHTVDDVKRIIEELGIHHGG